MIHLTPLLGILTFVVAAPSAAGDGMAHAGSGNEETLAVEEDTLDMGDAARKAHAEALWRRVEAAARATLDQPVWTPATPPSVIPWRKAHEARAKNREYRIVVRTGNRILRHAMVYDRTGDRRHLDAAWRQIEVLFDDEHWPEWRDDAHMGNRIDLRVGDLARALAQTYALIGDDLGDERRKAFIAGVDRKIIGPFLAAVDAREWTVRGDHNWTLRIVGGAGMMGAALGDAHAASGRIVEYADPIMFGYADVLGDDGSFNESPKYLPSLDALAQYVSFRRGHGPPIGTRGEAALGKLRGVIRWNVHAMLPPGRTVAFGDTFPDNSASGAYAAAVAAADRDELAQWLYLRDALRRVSRDIGDHDVDPWEPILFDPSVPATGPAGAMPLAKAYHEEGGLLVSRTGWDLSEGSDEVIVLGKHGREHNHAHHDAGTLTIDRGTRRLIRDLGTLSYPSDYGGKNRPRYYNDSPWGHNVPVFGDFDTDPLGGMKSDGRGELDSFEADENAVRWTLDLTPAYREGRRVTRRVLHVLPDVIAVLDEATPADRERVTLRWHTAEVATIEGDAFSFTHEGVPVAGRVVAVEGSVVTLEAGRHEYVAPYDTARTGLKLEQKREPFMEASSMANGPVRWLTLLAVGEAGGEMPEVRDAGEGQWEAVGGGRRVRVWVADGELRFEEAGRD